MLVSAGFDLGFQRAGLECRFQVEIDDYCNQVLAKHWPNVKRYRDVRKAHGILSDSCRIRCDTRRTEQPLQGPRAHGQAWKQGKHSCPSCLEPVDVICGGFPCQPFSAAGKRRGAEDDRNLWPEFKRIIEEVRPRWVVAENVPGLRTLYLDTVLSDLEGLEYTVETVIIPACAFDAPHRRDRLWIVAHTKRLEREAGAEVQRELRESADGRTHGAGIVADTISFNEGRNGIWGASWTSWRQRESTEAIQNVGERRGKENGQPTTESRLGNLADGVSPWLAEPRGIPRVATGIPNRVNRLKALGNAVVPQAAEFIGSLIVEVEAMQ